MDSFQIHENGTFDSTDPTIYFNVSSSLTKDSSNGVESLLSYIQASVSQIRGPTSQASVYLGWNRDKNDDTIAIRTALIHLIRRGLSTIVR